MLIIVIIAEMYNLYEYKSNAQCIQGGLYRLYAHMFITYSKYKQNIFYFFYFYLLKIYFSLYP